MPLVSGAELDAARARSRSQVHKRAAKAALAAAEPLGVVGSLWSGTLASMIDEIQDIYQLTPAQRAEIEPELLRGVADVLARYAPGWAPGSRMASIVETLRRSTLARTAAAGAATRTVRRLGPGLAGRVAVGAGAARALARRAWVVPLALGAGTTLLYELLGHRCIGQCDAYLRSRLAPGATQLTAAPAS